MLIASSSSIVNFHSCPENELVSSYKCKKSKDSNLIKSLSWSKDGTWFVLVPHKGHAEVLTLKENLKLLHTINIELPTCAAFRNTTKKQIALGTSSGQVLIYDMKSLSICKRLPAVASCSSIVKIICNSKDTHVIAASESGDILLYNIAYCALSNIFQIPKSRKINCICSYSTNYIAAGSEEGIVASWDINTKKRMTCTQMHAGPVEDLAFSPTAKNLLVSVGSDRYCTFFDVKTNQVLSKLVTEKTPLSLDFCGDNYLAIGCDNGYIYRYDLRSLKEPPYSFQAHNEPVRHLFFQKKSAEETSIVFKESKEESVALTKHESQRNTVSCDSFAMPDVNSGVYTAAADSYQGKIEEDSFMAQCEFYTASPLIPEDKKMVPLIKCQNADTPNKEEKNLKFQTATATSTPVYTTDIPSNIQHKGSKNNMLSPNDISPINKFITTDEQIVEPTSNDAENHKNSITITDVAPSNNKEVIAGGTTDKGCQTEGAFIDKSQLEELKKELRYEMMDNTRAIQQQLFSFRWFASSEFLLMQEKFDRLAKILLENGE